MSSAKKQKTAPDGKKKVALITGITGRTARYLAEFLLRKNYMVHGIIRRSSSFNTGRIEDLYQVRLPRPARAPRRAPPPPPPHRFRACARNAGRPHAAAVLAGPALRHAQPVPALRRPDRLVELLRDRQLRQARRAVQPRRAEPRQGVVRDVRVHGGHRRRRRAAAAQRDALGRHRQVVQVLPGAPIPAAARARARRARGRAG